MTDVTVRAVIRRSCKFVPTIKAGREPHRMLELIDTGQISEEHPHPLLFVHGAFHGAHTLARGPTPAHDA